MLTTFLHFPNGTHKAIEMLTSYDTYGYIPSHKDKLITAHIVKEDGYGYSLITIHKHSSINTLH